MTFEADIDIDTQTSFNASAYFKWTRASVITDGQITPHPCGVYAQPIPVDPITNLAALHYEDAEFLGYSKLDFLHLSVYDLFDSREEILEFDSKQPKWDLLTKSSVHPRLFQLAKHGELLQMIRPTSVLELSDVLAIIRPGKKRFLDAYLEHKEKIRPALYMKDDEGYSFKKSHAISYAKVICLQLHLIAEGRL